jgi:hypothetical protein
MFNEIQRPRADSHAKIWKPIIEAWRNLPDDEELVLVSDIVPMGFSDAALAAGYQKPIKMSWVWRKA